MEPRSAALQADVLPLGQRNGAHIKRGAHLGWSTGLPGAVGGRGTPRLEHRIARGCGWEGDT